MPETVYIALGSNLGEREAHLGAALHALGALAGSELTRRSGVIETDPVGPPGQGRYLNAAAELRTALSPRELLHALLAIEAGRGRDRAGERRWGPRTLDLDILVFGDRVVDEPGLTIPHPRLHERLFVLRPLCEIAPDLMLPGYEKTPRELLGVLETHL